MRQVAFRLLGCVPGHVGLRGRVQPLGDSRDTVKVPRPRSVHAGLPVRTYSVCMLQELWLCCP